MSMLPGALRAEHAKERWSDDWYLEPPECVHRLFDAVEFKGWIHDPCCGQGTIPTVAAQRGFKATGSDLRDRGFGEAWRDFFWDMRPRENIVSNPPYKLGEEFVAHALEVARRKVAIVMRLGFLSGQRRKQFIYGPTPPAEVIVLSKRPSMPPGGMNIPAKGGTPDYAWIVWDKHYSGPTIMKWA